MLTGTIHEVRAIEQERIREAARLTLIAKAQRLQEESREAPARRGLRMPRPTFVARVFRMQPA